MNRWITAGAAALATLGAPLAQAAGFDLGNYTLSGSYALDRLNGVGLEASAVTYARDRNSLFYVGDEGLGVVEISLTGQTLGVMALNWSGTGSTNQDSEGLTYLGNGQLVVRVAAGPFGGDIDLQATQADADHRLHED